MNNLPLVLDLVEWIAERPRPYDEVMDAWRTSCPRLTIWEDTVDAGFVRVLSRGKAGRLVTITSEGRDLLDRHFDGGEAAPLVSRPVSDVS